MPLPKNLERAKCKVCQREFVRQKDRGIEYCPAKLCQQIRRQRPVTFDGIPNRPSEYGADIDYHGGYRD